MKIIQSTLATTHVDRHGDMFTKESLESVANQVRLNYIPMMLNHDPRIPPQGRMISAKVKKLPDGHYALIATTEIFEPGDDLCLARDDREIILQTYRKNKLTIVTDRSYSSNEDQEIVQELSSLPDTCIETLEKKALEPISILLMALSASAVAFAYGFLNKMGADSWDFLKTRLSRLISRKQTEMSDYLFILELQADRETGPLSIQCILSSPSEEQFKDFYSNGLKLLNKLLPKLLNVNPDIRKLVIHYKKGKLIPGYAIRKDCVPLPLDFKLNKD